MDPFANLGAFVTTICIVMLFFVVLAIIIARMERKRAGKWQHRDHESVADDARPPSTHRRGDTVVFYVCAFVGLPFVVAYAVTDGFKGMF